MFPIALDLLGIFVDFFANIFNIVMILIFLCLGIIFGVLLKPWFGNIVIKLIPREHRFVDFDILEETACSIICKLRKGMPPQRFYKHKSGYTGVVGTVLKKPITRFFGKEGTAYTWSVGTDIKTPVKLTLWETIKHVWTDDFYNQIPEAQRKTLEASKLDVTIDLDEGLTPEGYRSVSEEDIKREEDREAAKTFWKGKSSAEKTQLVSLLITGIAGFGIACALQIIGILRISTGGTTTPPPTGNQTSVSLSIVVTAIRMLIGV